MSNKEIFSDYAFIGENLDLKKDVTLEIEDGTIVNISCNEAEEILHLNNTKETFLMIPGFINSHVHVGDSFAKELGFNKKLSEIVAPPYGLKHKLLRQTSKEIKLNGIRSAILEMISNGITCFIDFREGGVEGVNLLRNILKKSPIEALIYGRFMDESEIESVFDVADGIGLASYNQITDINKRWVIESKKRTSKKIATHCAERSRDNVILNDICDDKIVDIIIHGTKFIKSDLEVIKERGKSLILCPRSNGYFGVGFPPIIDILRLGIPVALGTDNVMLNNTDLFEEIRYLYRIARVLGNYDKSIELTSKELLKMITINPAKIFEIDKVCGSISEGKNANLLLINLKDPNFYTFEVNNIFNLVTQRTKPDNIKKTFIKGEVVFERD